MVIGTEEISLIIQLLLFDKSIPVTHDQFKAYLMKT